MAPQLDWILAAVSRARREDQDSLAKLGAIAIIGAVDGRVAFRRAHAVTEFWRKSTGRKGNEWANALMID